MTSRWRRIASPRNDRGENDLPPPVDDRRALAGRLPRRDPRHRPGRRGPLRQPANPRDRGARRAQSRGGLAEMGRRLVRTRGARRLRGRAGRSGRRSQGRLLPVVSVARGPRAQAHALRLVLLGRIDPLQPADVHRAGLARLIAGAKRRTCPTRAARHGHGGRFVLPLDSVHRGSVSAPRRRDHGLHEAAAVLARGPGLRPRRRHAHPRPGAHRGAGDRMPCRHEHAAGRARFVTSS